MVKKCKYLLIPILLLSFTCLAQDIEIKSLQAYSGNDQTGIPLVISYNPDINYLTIQFDVASDYEPNLNIVFRFCDKNWMPYDNIFLFDPSKNIARSLSLDLLPSVVEGARYHYTGEFPNDNDYVDFLYSGKWRFYITESNDTSIVYAEGKFIVVNDSTDISVSLKKETLEGEYLLTADMSKVFNISVNFNLQNGFFSSNLEHVEIIENHKLDYLYIINKNENNTNHAFYWDGGNNFRFFTREIKPGNEYRETDLRDPNLFNRKTVDAQLNGIETSRRYFNERRDLNGGSILLNYKDDYADYLKVNFKLRPSDRINNRVFVVGAFNNWKVLPEYEMLDQDGLYIGSFVMKRGVYDYQYVTADNNLGNISGIDWYSIEGNNWDTSNIYYIFLYYSEPQKGGYDRIIGYKKIVSH